uniref:Uncharacterized protein n=1 Tax=Phytophthora ramorum TaxID=164328 RepID=H3HCA1_PHYRM
MGWKAVESEEYESSAPAVQAHFHAVRAEDALRRDDYVQAEKEGHLASDKFLQAAQRVSDKRTIDALMLLAENYEYRAKAEAKVATQELRSEDKGDGDVQTEVLDPREGERVETQLNVAAAEMEELWRRLNEIGLSSPGSADKVDGAAAWGKSSARPAEIRRRNADEREWSDSISETVAHQKMEIVRLLNTVKTLSSENTKLVKKCEALTNVQAENREIRESMDRFKKDYNQKLVMIKKALEEWRRQRNSGLQAVSSPSITGGNSALESKLKMQEEQITKLMDEARIKDDRIAKYDKWYKTLKAGAKAKQLSQSQNRNGSSSFSSSSSFVQNSGGGLGEPSNSFTNSSSFHDYSPGSGESSGNASSSSSTPRQFSRPPAHPNRRAL